MSDQRQLTTSPQPIVPEILSPEDKPDPHAYLDDGLEPEDAREVRNFVGIGGDEPPDVSVLAFDPEDVLSKVENKAIDINTLHPVQRYHLVEYLHYEMLLSPTKIAVRLNVPVSRVRRDLDIIHNALGAKAPGSFLRNARGKWSRRNELLFRRAMEVNDLPTAARANEAFVTGMEKFGDIKAAPDEVHVTGEFSLLTLVSKKPPPKPVDQPKGDGDES
jgi:hypothetical protein